MQPTKLFAYSMATAAMVLSPAMGFKLTVQNHCTYNVDLVTREGGKYTDDKETLAVGASTTKEINKGFEGHFRHGTDVAATLVEFATKGDMAFAWYDISVIPPNLNPGHEFCSSLDDCKKNSASGKGFNVAVQVTPASNTNGANCRQLTCLADGCTDAYLFPKDDSKTHSCPLDTDFTLTFCPGGSSDQSQASASAPAPSTAAPTPAPTPAATPAPASTENESIGKVSPGNYGDDEEDDEESTTPAPAAKSGLESGVLTKKLEVTPSPTPVVTPAPTQAPAPVATPASTATAGGSSNVPAVTPAASSPKTPKPKICHS